MADDLVPQYRALDTRTDSMLSVFESRFSSLLARAQIRTTFRLRRALTVEEDGTIRPTAQNIRALRQLPSIFRQTLGSEGYDSLVVGFTASFNGGLPTMESILQKISRAYEVEIPKFTSQDRAYFEELKKNTSINLEAVIDLVAQGARQSTMFSVGGTPFEDFAVQLADRLHIAAGQADSIAATGISTFYRTIAAQGYEQIEDHIKPKGKELRYSYYGPLDVLNRSFCRTLEAEAKAGRTWSRDEIERMNNGQIPDVFTTCGGFRCRHQWIVALDKHVPLY